MSAKGRAAFVLALAGLASACALMTPARVETRTVVMNKVPSEVAQGRPRAATLLVATPNAAEPYDTTRMVYAKEAHQVAYFGTVQWSARPAQMIEPLLVQTLQATHAFGTVAAPPYTGHVNYTLRTDLRELRQDFTSGAPVLRLALHVELADEEAGRRLMAHDIALAEPMSAATPDAGVAAANEALAKALAEVARHIIAALG